MNFFSRFGIFFEVFGGFWSVSNLGFVLGNNPRRQRRHLVFKEFLKNFSRKFSIVTLREAKRGSAGVLVAKREAAGDTQSVQEMTM